MPEPSTGDFTPVANHTGDHLAGPTAQSDPFPGLVALPLHKGPEFVQFKLRSLGVIRVRLEESVA